MLDDTRNAGTYEAPRMTLLGSVHGLTQDTPKVYGPSDGFTFNNNTSRTPRRRRSVVGWKPGVRYARPTAGRRAAMRFTRSASLSDAVASFGTIHEPPTQTTFGSAR